MLIYAFEGPNNLCVNESLADAEEDFEAIGVENQEYVFFGDDGTVIAAGVHAGRVVLTPTTQVRIEELRDRLRTYLAQPPVAVDPALADDPPALARLLLDREREVQQRRWLFNWLTRRRRPRDPPPGS